MTHVNDINHVAMKAENAGVFSIGAYNIYFFLILNDNDNNNNKNKQTHIPSRSECIGVCAHI